MNIQSTHSTTVLHSSQMTLLISQNIEKLPSGENTMSNESKSCFPPQPWSSCLSSRAASPWPEADTPSWPPPTPRPPPPTPRPPRLSCGCCTSASPTYPTHPAPAVGDLGLPLEPLEGAHQSQLQATCAVLSSLHVWRQSELTHIKIQLQHHCN